MRTSFVQIDGKLYEIGPDKTVLIGSEKWACFGGRWAPISGPIGQSFMVMKDIEPYHSMIDGSLISSRSRHREHLREHGCIEVGNERVTPKAPDFQANRGLREELAARIYG